MRDALTSDRNVRRSCEVLGARLAADGWTLEETLDGLEATYWRVRGMAPELDAIRALLASWAESTLRFLHDMSCEDPLTGLASRRHVGARLAEIYRGETAAGQSPALTHALLVVEPHGSRSRRGMRSVEWELRLAEIAEGVRAVYPGSETVGRVGARRVVAIVRRDQDLGERVALLRQLLVDWDHIRGERKKRQRVWIEGLPRHHDLAVRLLDELAR